MRQPDRGFWKGKRVCVTGGSGFLGFHLVQRLLAVGARVVLHALPPRPDHPVMQLGVPIVSGDIRDPQSVRRALDGSDVIFHTAGLVAVTGPAVALMHEVHEVGTRNVLAEAHFGARIVHTSSLVAVGASRQPTPLTEDSPFPLGRVKLPYVHAKRAAEELALQAAARGRDVVVVNPAYLIGPDDHERSVMGRLCQRFWKGRLPLIPPGGVNVVDVRDVATGHLLAAEYGLSGRRYLLGGEDHTFASLFRLLAEVAGMRPRALPRLGLLGMTLLALFAEARARLRGVEAYPSIGHVRLNRYHWFCSSDRARLELGFCPRSAAASLADAHAWFARQGTVQPRGFGRWWMRPGEARAA